MALKNNKSLGQHWLRDQAALDHIADLAELTFDDTVLEIGPGLGTLTSVLLRRAGYVVAVEFDSELARKLPGQFPGKNLNVVHHDILTYDLSTLPRGYKVVANVPYYITSKIVQTLLGATNTPVVIVLLVQKEVAERLAAGAGDMSILALSAQRYARVTLGHIVPAELFTPPPKVDSQVVVLHCYEQPLFSDLSDKDFFRPIKAGFAAKRKKLRSSLSAGLRIDKKEAEALLREAAIDPELRAEQLLLDDWNRLARLLMKSS